MNMSSGCEYHFGISLTSQNEREGAVWQFHCYSIWADQFFMKAVRLSHFGVLYAESSMLKCLVFSQQLLAPSKEYCHADANPEFVHCSTN